MVNFFVVLGALNTFRVNKNHGTHVIVTERFPRFVYMGTFWVKKKLETLCNGGFIKVPFTDPRYTQAQNCPIVDNTNNCPIQDYNPLTARLPPKLLYQPCSYKKRISF